MSDLAATFLLGMAVSTVIDGVCFLIIRSSPRLRTLLRSRI